MYTCMSIYMYIDDARCTQHTCMHGNDAATHIHVYKCTLYIHVCGGNVLHIHHIHGLAPQRLPMRMDI